MSLHQTNGQANSRNNFLANWTTKRKHRNESKPENFRGLDDFCNDLVSYRQPFKKKLRGFLKERLTDSLKMESLSNCVFYLRMPKISIAIILLAIQQHEPIKK